MANLRRVLDPDLPADARLESFRLLRSLGAEDARTLERLSHILSEPNCPVEVRTEVLSFLSARNQPGLAEYVVPALGDSGQSPEVRNGVLDWLMRNPSPEALSEVVKLWSDEPSATGPDESRYRGIVERIAGKPWADALVSGINSNASFPRGRALEVLIARVPRADARKRILGTHPETEAMAALQSFVETFDYLPANRNDFASAATIFKTRIEMMNSASRLAGQWSSEYRYAFRIADFHLLSRLARDPLRAKLGRTELILEVSTALAARRRVSAGRSADSSAAAASDLFDAQVQDLSMADLWNMYLLNEMLNRPRMHLALGILAETVDAEPTAARDGLVFYQNGQAEAMLYPQAPATEEAYGPDRVSLQMVQDGRDSLCRFYTHFGRTGAIGPNAEELADARQQGYYGLIVAGVNAGTCCAHYFNPDGKVVSLGTFPLPR
jgi:hypothetical protein